MFKLNSIGAVTSLIAGMTLILATLACMSFAATADAATYAYVDQNGDVKSVVADDWMTAINIAPNRHIHSGVLLLKSVADFGIVGDEVRVSS